MLNRPHRAASFLHLLTSFLLTMSCSVFGVEPEILVGITVFIRLREGNPAGADAADFCQTTRRQYAGCLSQTGLVTLIRYRAELVPDSGIGLTLGGHFIQHEVEEQFTELVAEMKRRSAP